MVNRQGWKQSCTGCHNEKLTTGSTMHPLDDSKQDDLISLIWKEGKNSP